MGKTVEELKLTDETLPTAGQPLDNLPRRRSGRSRRRRQDHSKLLAELRPTAPVQDRRDTSDADQKPTGDGRSTRDHEPTPAEREEPKVLPRPKPVAVPPSAASTQRASPTPTPGPTRLVSEVHEIIGPLRETLETECPESESLVEGLVDRGQIVNLFAKPGTGKTPFTTQLVSAAACGAHFLGFPTRRCRIGIIDVESHPSRHRSLLQSQWAAMELDPADVSDRIDVFVRGNPHDPNSRELDRIMHRSNDEKGAWLANLTRDRGYDWVVIDTILNFIPFKAGDERQARALFARLSNIRRTPPFPAITQLGHLRKQDSQTQRPSLLEDPFTWTEEFLGSIVWSANADVRLGLEAFGEDGHRVFSGFRRGEGEITPRIIEPVLHEIDGKLRPVKWDLVDPAVLPASVLSKNQQKYFQQFPIGKDLTWGEVVALCGNAKSTASRLIKKTRALGVVDYDEARGVYRRKV